MLAYRTSVQETTGATPFSLIFGRSAHLPIDIEFNLPSTSHMSLNQYQSQLQNQLQQAYTTVREHSLAEQTQQKRLYDRSIHGPEYEIGDEVWLHCPAVPKGHCKKFHHPWQGPFTVVKVIDNFVYRIQYNATPRKRFVVHYNRLKPYYPPFNTDVYGPDNNMLSKDNDSTHQLTGGNQDRELQKSKPEMRDDANSQDVQDHAITQQNTTTHNPSLSLRRSRRAHDPLIVMGKASATQTVIHRIQTLIPDTRTHPLIWRGSSVMNRLRYETLIVYVLYITIVYVL